ncbi:MAG: alpha/beta fold hydrolase [Shewanella sp.]|nr:alpha/beta fold hydrolase [Shewanella sp.]
MKQKWITPALLMMVVAGQIKAAPLLTETLTPPAGGSSPLTIERMYASPALAGSTPRGLKLSPDGRLVTFLAARENDQHFYDLWQIEVSTGKRSKLLNADKLAVGELSNEEKARRERQRIYGQGIMEYFWSADSKALLIPASGKLYHHDIISGHTRLLKTGEGFATDARLSPKGNYVSWVADQNLYVMALVSGNVIQLTKDGGGAIKNAMAEFVAQEEMDRMTGYWWAPDESAIAFTRIDESPVELVVRNEIYADGIKLTEQRYPYAGKPNVLIDLGTVQLADGKINWIDLGEEKDIYLPRVKWLNDSRHLSFQWQSRQQQQLDLRIVDTQSSDQAVTVLAEHSDAWLNLNNDLIFLKQQDAFIWASERSGYKHLYLYDLKGKLISQLTDGQWSVDDVEYVDEAQGLVYFSGRRDTPLERHIYRVSLTQPEQGIIRLSRRVGMHNPEFAKSSPVYLDYFSSLVQPPQVSLHDQHGALTQWIEQNIPLKGHPLEPYFGLWQVPEFGTLKAEDGQTLYYRLHKPTDFDASRKYPVVVRVYGGPHAQLVTNSWSEHDYFTQHLLQRGYLVFQLDNRGSGNRGTRFEQAIYLNMGDAEVEDQKAGVDFLRTLLFVAGDRIAIYGHSYGGYMALMSQFKAPDYFRAAISGAPVTDWSLYDTHYTERYMGQPQTNAEGYQRASVFPYVSNYQRGLLIYHGMADDNVLFENSTRLYKALQDEGKLFEMIDYPGSKHSMQGEKVRVHLYRSLADFLDRQLKPGD